jgi:hypothetical protein
MLGQVPKWTKGADCKSVAIGFQGSNPCLPTIEPSVEWRVLSAEIRPLYSEPTKCAGVAQW